MIDMKNDLFLRACRKKAVECTPIWLMRQAGRYMPQYRKIRESHSVMEICKDPDISSDVSAMPIEMFGLDAAIIFEDLMVPLEPAGIKFKLVDNVGPVIEDTIRSSSDVRRIKEYDVGEVGFVADAIKKLKGKVDVPVIGFAGGPFTISCYLIDGFHSKEFEKTQKLIKGDPETFNLLMDKLTDIVINYLGMQVRAGADAIQLFDTWSGIIDSAAYHELVMPHSRKIFESVSAINPSVPRIHFALNSMPIIKDIATSGCDVVGIDWRSSISEAWSMMDFSKAIQGNLDPLLLVQGGSSMTDHAINILRQANGRKGHIFNLGHGILPQTDPENVKKLVDTVHSFQAHDTHIPS